MSSSSTESSSVPRTTSRKKKGKKKCIHRHLFDVFRSVPKVLFHRSRLVFLIPWIRRERERERERERKKTGGPWGGLVRLLLFFSLVVVFCCFFFRWKFYSCSPTYVIKMGKNESSSISCWWRPARHQRGATTGRKGPPGPPPSVDPQAPPPPAPPQKKKEPKLHPKKRPWPLIKWSARGPAV